MEREKVESSLLESVGYDSQAQVLEIELKDGRVYRYLDVPADVHQALLSAGSLGQFFNAEIRDHYSLERVR